MRTPTRTRLKSTFTASAASSKAPASASRRCAGSAMCFGNRMRAKSLRRELLLWLLLPLAAVVSLNLWTTYRNALTTADLITDRTLLASAKAIAENLRQSEGVLEAPIPPAALEMFASDPPDRVVYRVTAPGGQLLAGHADVPVPPRTPENLQPLYFSAAYENEPVRAVAVA